MKRLYIITLSLFLIWTIPSVAVAQIDEEVEAALDAVTLTVRDGKVHVTNAEGKNLEIYNITGVRVSLIRIDNNDKQINLNLARGCYILKVGKVVRKVTILQ
ncbi:MAG: T9SS type A sorting domain-containing protein [Bacteroides sp.]|nr:T9SS type A sorting domain-containing protein [Bacteroides sp.]MCM1447363.1 T9SS type A sorting domain-containing protein [Bacteroides sp.]MCM1515851.1 T9SS type A sorting domain-containing protein [Paraprevotella sp.]